MLHFLFPSDPFSPRAADELFREQMSALTEAGFSASVVPDTVVEEGKPLRGIPAGSRVVYRGWMLRPDGYERLAAAIENAEATPFTTAEEYVAAHYLPNWYPLVREFTPETRVFPPDEKLVMRLEALGWDAYFVKDYVKSLKTSFGSLIHEPSQITQVLAEMHKFRGEIEGGVCIRRVEDFQPDSERRYFVLEGRPTGPDASEEIPDLVRTCAERIPSPFFSADVAKRQGGRLRIVEIGDGQVSDLVGWSPTGFAQLWHHVAA